MSEKKLPKVLFICRKRIHAYGEYIMSVGLYNSAKFLVNYLESQNIEAKVVIVDDSNGIDREVHNYKPTHVIIHALWVTPVKILELARKYKGIDWQIRIHSKIPFIATEGIAMDWIAQYSEMAKNVSNLYLSANSMEACFDLSKMFNIKFAYLPNIYYPDDKMKDNCNEIGETVNIGCFGAIRPLKNHLLQAMVAIEYGKENAKFIRFHINSDVTEQNGSQVLKNLKALFSNTPYELVEHGWSNHHEFLDLVGTMDVGMQVSISETYNIVAADFVYMGVPIVVSNEIDWLPEHAMANPMSFKSISDVLKYNIVHRHVVKENMHCLEKYNVKSEGIWLKYLHELDFIDIMEMMF